jgi:hypothetical protein
MAYDIIIGRDSSDKEKFGDKGLVYIGKGYVKMGQYTSLSNKIWMDVARNHVILISGKRGSGKSYTLGAIAEELSALDSETAKNITSLIFDTMGIFWTMKYENEKDSELLEQWELKPKKLPVKIFVPFGKEEDYKKKQIPFDATFALKVSELEAEDWITLFNIQLTSLPGVLIERIINELKESGKFNVADIISAIAADKASSPDTKEIASSLFQAADTWGIFSKTEEGTEVKDLLTPGTTTILDTSVYASSGSFNIRALVISLISKKIFKTRMDSRKQEEMQSIQHGQNYSSFSKKQDPLVWIFIDECHEYLSKDEKTPATDALIQLLREGRQPGISLVLATQQPAKLHADVFTQSDIVISHRVTSRPDIEALNNMMQTYSLEGIKQQFDDLPSLKGSAILLDDNSERIYPIRVRPRFTWHGGESPTAIKTDFKI